MTRRVRRTCNPAFKAKVVLAAIRGEKTLTELRSSMTFTRTRVVEGSGTRGGPPICLAT